MRLLHSGTTAFAIWVLSASLVVAQSAAPAAVSGDPAAASAPADHELLAMARALFEEGLAFVDAAQWEAAADRFSRVLEMRYSAVAAYNLGLAQARLGKLMVAAESLRRLLTDAALEPKVRDASAALLAEVERDQGWLRVEIAGPCEACSLRVDDKEWPTAVWGVAVPIDPGSHSIDLWQGGARLRSQQVEIAVSARVEETLRAHEDVPEPAVVAAMAQPPTRASTRAGDERATSGQIDTAEPAGRSVWRSPWLWVAVGAVAVGAVTTALVLSSDGSGQELAAPVKGDFMPQVIAGRVDP